MELRNLAKNLQKYESVVTSFNRNELLRSIHHLLALDRTYWPDDNHDIGPFFSDGFKYPSLIS